MKKRRYLSVLVALLVALSMTVTAMAVEYKDVDSFDELKTAFNYDGEDQEIVITLSGDIRFAEKLDALEGKIITIEGKSYILEDVILGGNGEVTINADVNAGGEENAASGYDALTAYDSVKVTVNGDIDSATNDGDDGVQAENSSSVTVNGDITAGSDGVIGYDDATIQVTGNIWAENNEGVDANDNSTVTVVGNVVAEDDDGVAAGDTSTVYITGNVHSNTGNDAVDATDNAQVEVTGNVSSAGGSGVEADGDAKVLVTGNVTGATALKAEENAQVAVDGNVVGNDGVVGENGSLDQGDMSDPYGYSDGGNGVYADQNAVVVISGDVTGGKGYGTDSYGGDGVQARDSAVVMVYGNVAGGDVEADPTVEKAEDAYGSIAGDGIQATPTANVMVGGNATGGSSNADGGMAGNGVYIYLVAKEAEGEEAQESGIVTIEGTAAAGGNSNGNNGYGIAWTQDVAETEEFLPEDQLLLSNVIVHAITVPGEGELFGNSSEVLEDTVYYFIDVPENDLGSVTTDVPVARAGETVTVTVEPNAGYTLTSLSAAGGKLEVVDGQATFVMPEGGDVTVQARFMAEGNNGNPDTGDHAMPVFCGILMVMALCGICAVVWLKKLRTA